MMVGDGRQTHSRTGSRWGVSKKLWRTLSLPSLLGKPTKIRVQSVVEEYAPPKNHLCPEGNSDEHGAAKQSHLQPSSNSSSRTGNENEATVVVKSNTAVMDQSYYWWERQLDRGFDRSCEPDVPCMWFSPPKSGIAAHDTSAVVSQSRFSFLHQNITSRLHEEIEVTATHHVKVRHPPTHPKLSRAPFRDLRLDHCSSSSVVSELTLRSCAAEPAEHRRMAYYAVGQHHDRTTALHGNRRCYFSGKIIMNQPFYAGILLQGLRTLVVFCLPSSIALGTGQRIPKRRSGLSVLSDDLSNVDGDLDVHWNVDKEILLDILPEANKDTLKAMMTAYPAPFETLPVQIQAASCWRLFSKFCFFSGLPIAPDELHYKVKEVIADEVYGDEIALSHEVMDASSDAAELLTLPSSVVMAYLRQHYPQQCGKLEERVFRRSSWERVETRIKSKQST